MVTVREAVPGDAGEIARTHIATWRAAYAHVFPPGYLASLDPADWAERRRKWLLKAPPSNRTYVAIDDDALVGHASSGAFRLPEGTTDPRIGEVYAINVVPARWSAGVGLALMRASVAHLTGIGFTEIRLWVLERNPRARRFYERFGFAADGHSDTYTVDPAGPDPGRATELRYTLHVR